VFVCVCGWGGHIGGMDNNSPFVFCVDLDGVVGKYHEAFRGYVARYKNLDPAQLPEATNWDFALSGWPISGRDEYLELHARAVEEGMFASMEPIENVSEVLWRLSDDDIWIRVVTHRLLIKGSHAQVVSDTVGWLQQDVGGRPMVPYRDLCFVAEKPDVGGHLYVDDAPHNITNLRASGINAVVFDQPYNQHLDGDRVTNWLSLEQYVRSAAQKHYEQQS